MNPSDQLIVDQKIEYKLLARCTLGDSSENLVNGPKDDELLDRHFDRLIRFVLTAVNEIPTRDKVSTALWGLTLPIRHGSLQARERATLLWELGCRFRIALTSHR